MAVIVALVVAQVVCWLAVSGFNLDPRIPIYKTAGADPESFFGYSVAQHRTLRSPEYGEPLLLVGAPQDQNLQPETHRSGALWQCKLSADPEVRQRLHFLHLYIL
jgi:hypothetical protein